MNSLPSEVLLFIFHHVNVNDLFSCELVCKFWLDLLDSNGALWKTIAKQELDVTIHDDEDLKQAKKLATIKINIHQCRCVCSALAVPTIDWDLSKNFYLGYCSYNDRFLVVNWIRKEGSGSGEFYHRAHSAIIDLKTRLVKTVYSAEHSCPVLHGPYLTQMVWSGYHIDLVYTNTKHAKIDSNDRLVATVDFPKAYKIIHNEDLDRQHLIALILGENAVNDEINLKIQIYDLEHKKIHCQIELRKFENREFYSMYNSSFVFKGDKIYALKREGGRLTAVDINHPQEHHVNDIEFFSNDTVLTGVSETFLFGTSEAKKVWCYNRKTKTMAVDNSKISRYVHSVKWYCGTLMAFKREKIVFLDPFSPGTELKVISTLTTDGFGFTNSTIYHDGKVITSSIRSSVKMFDFLHVNHNAQLLEITGPKDMTPHNIKSHQLTEKLTHLLGTGDFQSRYLNISSEERCVRNTFFFVIDANNKTRYGVVFTELTNGPKLPVNMKRLNVNPEYNSPYFAMHMVPGDQNETKHIVQKSYEVPKTIYAVHKVVVLFYEQFDGNNWRLGTPRSWNEGLVLLFGQDESKCLIQ